MSSSSQSIPGFKKALHFAPISTSTPELEEALFVAARKGDNLEIDRLRKRGVNLYAQNSDRYTALHIAILNGQTETIVHLVENHEMDVYANIDNDGNTVLHLAAWGGQIKIIDLFVCKYHMDAHAKNKYGYTILHLVASEGHLEPLKYLVEECHMNIYDRGENGYTILHLVASGGHLELLKYLVEQRHMNIYDRGENGCTLLHLAARNGRLAIMKYLVEERDMKVHDTTDDGCTALHAAALGNQTSSIRYLVEKCSMDVYAKTEKGNTPLHLAAWKGYISPIRYLVKDHGMYLYTLTNDQQTIWDIAEQCNHIELAKHLSQEYKIGHFRIDSSIILEFKKEDFNIDGSISLPAIPKMAASLKIVEIVDEKEAFIDSGIKDREVWFKAGVRFMLAGRLEKAHDYLQRAFEQEHPLAACYLGILYDVSSVHPINAALYLYTEGDSSFPLQQVMLAICFLRHLKTASGFEAGFAANLLQTALTSVNGYQTYDYRGIVGFFEGKKSLNAYLFLAMVYTRGLLGFTKSKVKAKIFFNEIKKTGDAWTWFNIGFLYEKGLWVERDYQKAKIWYTLAAEKGLTRAQQFLSTLYRYGNLGVADIEEADRWGQLADSSENKLRATPRLPVEPLPSIDSIIPAFFKNRLLQLRDDSTSGYENEKVRRVIVLYDWPANRSDRLSISSGQILYVLKGNSTDNWWLCKNRDGRKGKVPYNFLKELPIMTSSADSSRTSVPNSVSQIKSTELVSKEKLGAGTFGTVSQVRLSGSRYALKEPILDSEDDKKGFEKELALMAGLRHPNLVMLFGYTHDTIIPHLVMEFMDKGTLYDYLGGREDISIFLSQVVRYSIAMHIVSGLAYLHDIIGIIHRDLKSENVLLCHQQDNPFFAKIGDFGTSVFLPDKRTVFRTNELIGTAAYMEPDLLKVLIYKESELYEYTQKTDIFSLAIILWELMTHKKPYKNKSFQTTHEACEYVLRGGRETIVEGEVPPAWSKLIKRCWAQNSKDRPCANEIIAILEQSRKDDLPVEVEAISSTSKGKEEEVPQNSSSYTIIENPSLNDGIRLSNNPYASFFQAAGGRARENHLRINMAL